METTQAIHGQGPSRRETPVPTSSALVFLAVNLALLAGAAWAMAAYGSVARAVAYHLRGETLFLDSTEKSFGVIAPGGSTVVTFKMFNYGPTPIRVLGCRSACTCLLVSDIPMTIPENGSRDLVTRVRTSAKEGAPETTRLDAELVLFTSNANQSRVHIHVKGEVRGKPNSTSKGS